VNFLAHYVLATRFLTPVLPLSFYVIGTALPDLLPLTAEKARLRPAQLTQATAPTDYGMALGAGVGVHLETDRAFHKTRAFTEAQAEVTTLLARTPFEGIRIRRFFIAHVLTELALDAVLLRIDPAIADSFYAAFAEADLTAVTRWTKTATGYPLTHLTDVLTRFARSQYLRHYSDDDGVATGLSRLCQRARQDTFDGENFTQLVAVVGETIALLPHYLPSLFSETAADIPH
jgi:hypothetical protein